MTGRLPKCTFANVVLWNRWMASYEYRFGRRISLNRKQMKLQPDGSYRIVIAHRDPGVPNWLDTEGRPFGHDLLAFPDAGGAARAAAGEGRGAGRSGEGVEARGAGRPGEGVDAGGARARGRRPRPRAGAPALRDGAARQACVSRVVLDRPEAVYSGMVPGFVAGDYARAGARDRRRAARAPRGRARGARGRDGSRSRRRSASSSRAGPPLDYDVASLDVGATRARRSSCRACASTRSRRGRSAASSIALDAALAAARARAAARSCASRSSGAARRASSSPSRWRRGCAPRACAAELRRGRRHRGAAARRLGPARARRAARGRGAAASRSGSARACRASRRTGCCSSARRSPSRRISSLWATGAAPLPLLAEAPLPKDAQGFLRVRDTLPGRRRDDLFAAGDCAALDAHPWLPKAGVYAVREGPILDANLRARLAGGPLRATGRSATSSRC